MKKKFSFTVKKLLELKTIEGLEIIAGKKGIEKSIYDVNIVDNPDSFEWFKAGDFLMSSGYFLKTSATNQRRMIKELAERNCAGLGIKIDRYWTQMPEAIISECNKLDFPLIVIPYKYSLSQISNEINNEVYFRENSLLNRYKKMQDVFTNCSFEENVVGNILKKLGEIINNSVILLNSEFQLIDYFEHFNEKYKINEFIDLKIGDKCFSPEFLDGIPKKVDKLPVSIKRVLVTDEMEIICKIFPIVYSKNIYGYLIVWETLKDMEYMDLIAIKNASLFISLDRIKIKQIEEALIKEKEDFFDDLIQNKIVSMNALRSLAKIYGLDPDGRYIVLNILLNSYGKGCFKTALDILTDICNLKNLKFQYVYRQSFIILFLPFSKESPEEKIWNIVEELVEKISGDFDKRKINYDKIIVSPLCKEFLEIGKTVLMTMDMLKLTEQIKYDEKVCYFRDIRGFYFLNNFVKRDNLKFFYERVLGKLERYDRENSGNLIETFDYYFKANQNIAVASKMMNIHRNTFLYRLDKIKILLNDGLNNSETLFTYQLALHIKKIIDD